MSGKIHQIMCRVNQLEKDNEKLIKMLKKCRDFIHLKKLNTKLLAQINTLIQECEADTHD